MVPTPTAQEVFDTAVGGVLKQGRPSVSPDSDWACRYRGADGTKCSFGHLIPDDGYARLATRLRDPESWSMPQLVASLADMQVIDLLPHVDLAGRGPSLLSELIRAHDDAVMSERGNQPEPFLAVFRKHARDVAQRYGLSTAVLDQPAPV